MGHSGVPGTGTRKRCRFGPGSDLERTPSATYYRSRWKRGKSRVQAVRIIPVRKRTTGETWLQTLVSFTILVAVLLVLVILLRYTHGG